MAQPILPFCLQALSWKSVKTWGHNYSFVREDLRNSDWLSDAINAEYSKVCDVHKNIHECNYHKTAQHRQRQCASWIWDFLNACVETYETERFLYTCTLSLTSPSTVRPWSSINCQRELASVPNRVVECIVEAFTAVVPNERVPFKSLCTDLEIAPSQCVKVLLCIRTYSLNRPPASMAKKAANLHRMCAQLLQSSLQVLRCFTCATHA